MKSLGIEKWEMMEPKLRGMGFSDSYFQETREEVLRVEEMMRQPISSEEAVREMQMRNRKVDKYGDKITIYQDSNPYADENGRYNDK